MYIISYPYLLNNSKSTCVHHLFFITLEHIACPHNKSRLYGSYQRRDMHVDTGCSKKIKIKIKMSFFCRSAISFHEPLAENPAPVTQNPSIGHIFKLAERLHLIRFKQEATCVSLSGQSCCFEIFSRKSFLMFTVSILENERS